MLFSCHNVILQAKDLPTKIPLNDAVRGFSIQISLPYRVNGLCEAYFELSLAIHLLRELKIFLTKNWKITKRAMHLCNF